MIQVLNKPPIHKAKLLLPYANFRSKYNTLFSYIYKTQSNTNDIKKDKTLSLILGTILQHNLHSGN